MFDWDELRRALKEEYLSSKVETVDCPLCFSRDYSVWHEDYFRVVRCDDCGLYYTSPRTASEELIAQYSAIDYSGGPLGYLFHPENDYWPQQMEEFMRTVGRLKKIKSRGRLLDIGCLFGGLLLAARAEGYEVCGTEVSHQAVDYARKKFGLDIFRGTLFEANYPDSSFDMVTMTDVLDHLPEPFKILQEVCRILKKGGAVFVQAPDFECYRFRTLGTQAPEVLPGHLLYFTRDTLEAMMRKAGFKSVRTRPLPRVKKIFLRDYLPALLGRACGEVSLEIPLSRKHSTMIEAFGFK